MVSYTFYCECTFSSFYYMKYTNFYKTIFMMVYYFLEMLVYAININYFRGKLFNEI